VVSIGVVGAVAVSVAGGLWLQQNRTKLNRLIRMALAYALEVFIDATTRFPTLARLFWLATRYLYFQ
jgi:hypothetical protein